MKLKNVGPRPFHIEVTKVPLSAPHKSPKPDLIQNPENPHGEKILNPSMVTQTDIFDFAPGETIEFGEGKKYNEEQAEYIYKMLGQGAEGGEIVKGNPQTRIQNKNYIIEIDEKGKEIQDGDHTLWTKYRKMSSPTQSFTDALKIEAVKEPVKEEVKE